MEAKELQNALLQGLGISASVTHNKKFSDSFDIHTDNLGSMVNLMKFFRANEFNIQHKHEYSYLMTVIHPSRHA